jgi:hypothetical protein
MGSEQDMTPFEQAVISEIRRIGRDHEDRLRKLERKSDIRSMVVSLITSILTIAAAAMAGVGG